MLLPVTEGDWVQIFPAGITTGNDGRGPYRLDNPEEVVAASRRANVDMVVDRDHITDKLPGMPAPAAGWIKELKVVDGSIMARIEWTPPAKQQLQDKEYRYISPTFFHDKAGRITRIVRASLTNDPNFEMKAVAASERESSTNKESIMDKLLQDLAALLGLEGEKISESAVVEAVKNLQASVNAVKETVDAPAEANTPDALVEAVDNKIDAEVQKEVASAQAKATASATRPDPAKYVPIEAFNEVKDQVATLTKESGLTKATASVDAALKAGKITPAQKDWALDYASSDPKGFDKYIEKAPALIKETGTGQYTAETASAQNGLTNSQSTVAHLLGVDSEAMKSQLKKQA